MMKYLKPIIFLFLFIPSILFAQTEKVDTTLMNQIRKEGFQNSKGTILGRRIMLSFAGVIELNTNCAKHGTGCIKRYAI